MLKKILLLLAATAFAAACSPGSSPGASFGGGGLESTPVYSSAPSMDLASPLTSP